MSSREMLPFVLAFLGGPGGFANAIAYMDMITALNAGAPPTIKSPK
jgi:hypothetical protein